MTPAASITSCVRTCWISAFEIDFVPGDLSTITTRAPCRVSSPANISPTGPAPITTTSTLIWSTIVDSPLSPAPLCYSTA